MTRYILLVFLFSTLACSRSSPPDLSEYESSELALAQIDSASIKISLKAAEGILEDSLNQVRAFRDKLHAFGLFPIVEYCTQIKFSLPYASEDNFTGRRIYYEMVEPFARMEVIKMLRVADSVLRNKYPTLRLKILDAFRPNSAQFIMWEEVKGTPLERYVASPLKGSLHNLGTAIDLSLIDTFGVEQDMGTGYDHFGEEAEPRHQARLLEEGILNEAQLRNRWILKWAMKEGGFQPILTEWWHFNAYSKEVSREKFEMPDL